MNRLIALTATVALLWASAIASDPKTDDTAAKTEKKSTAELKSDKEKASYAIGLQIGEQLKLLKDNLDLTSLLKGLEDKFGGVTPALSDEEAESILQEFGQKMQQEQMSKRKEKAEANQKAGEAFLEENKKKEGVKVTESGLQYKVIREGDGAKPAAADTVKVNYRGTLIDGTEFDSSYKRNVPATFPVQGVIKGWTEALQLMKVGSKYELYVPADLAYGPHGPGEIGPNATLIFEVELLGIEKPEADKATEDTETKESQE